MFAIIDRSSEHKEAKSTPLSSQLVSESSSCEVQSVRLQVDNLSFAYASRPEVQVLKNINLNLSSSSTSHNSNGNGQHVLNGLIAVCGKSGSGKSTLLRVISGLYHLQVSNSNSNVVKSRSGSVAISFTTVTNDDVSKSQPKVKPVELIFRSDTSANDKFNMQGDFARDFFQKKVTTTLLPFTVMILSNICLPLPCTLKYTVLYRFLSLSNQLDCYLAQFETI